MGASRADAEEITQETMIAAWRKWDSIREPAAWVRTTATRKLWKSNHQRPVTRPLDENTAELPGSEPNLAVFSEEQQLVLGLLRQLPQTQRIVAALYYDGPMPNSPKRTLVSSGGSAKRQHGWTHAATPKPGCKKRSTQPATTCHRREGLGVPGQWRPSCHTSDKRFIHFR